MDGRATLTIVVSRLMARTAAQTVARIAALWFLIVSSEVRASDVDAVHITVARYVPTVNIP
jgi:hypothetical protein